MYEIKKRNIMRYATLKCRSEVSLVIKSINIREECRKDYFRIALCRYINICNTDKQTKRSIKCYRRNALERCCKLGLIIDLY